MILLFKNENYDVSAWWILNFLCGWIIPILSMDIIGVIRNICNIS